MKRIAVNEMICFNRFSKEIGIFSFLCILFLLISSFFYGTARNHSAIMEIAPVYWADGCIVEQEILPTETHKRQNCFNGTQIMRDRVYKRTVSRRQYKSCVQPAAAIFFQTKNMILTVPPAVCDFFQNFHYTSQEHKFNFSVRDGPHRC